MSIQRSFLRPFARDVVRDIVRSYGVTSTFSPADMFANGEAGTYLVAGTDAFGPEPEHALVDTDSPAVVPDEVGHLGDQRSLGPEIITDHAALFTTGLNASIAVTATEITFADTPSGIQPIANPVLTEDDWYYVQLTVADLVGTLRYRFGSLSLGDINNLSNGTHRHFVKADGTGIAFRTASVVSGIVAISARRCGAPAVQHIAGTGPILADNAWRRFLDFTGGKTLSVTLPTNSQTDWTCATRDSAGGWTFEENLALTGAITLPATQWSEMILIDRELTGGEKANLVNFS